MPLFGHRSLGEDYENNIKKEVDSDNEVSVYNEEEYDGDVNEEVVSFARILFGEKI